MKTTPKMVTFLICVFMTGCLVNTFNNNDTKNTTSSTINHRFSNIDDLKSPIWVIKHSDTPLFNHFSFKRRVVDGPLRAKSQKKIALTFDDGPHGTYTQEIIQLLEIYDANATFFMLGAQVELYPEVVQSLVDKGYEIGNHTWNHKDLTKLSKEEVIFQINETSHVIEEITGERTILFRPPYGSTNYEVERVVKQRPILWDVDPMDWEVKDSQSIFRLVIENVTNHSIILLHDIYEWTVEALALILPFLKEQGYQFVTVSELEK
ncbi:polysaccharide deacetylase family protein [Bacillus carboniphilus]|uniref:Polysaccharide deacetylase family protein n=1 Tax=Bacillus carboniphilus TaxID=86663 RepID=A0ABY9JTI7_9BACI|nr:polysaccharide deacetylase family protein [Bacillus carboniphilus]WLR42712.1 polysaccharide deacetylase family protein [Bacillus carboniphilus]